MLTVLTCVPLWGWEEPKDKDEAAKDTKPVRLVSAEKEQQLRRQLPKVDSPQIQEVLDDPALILYTDAEMPKAYQDWGSGLPGIHSPSYNISANRGEPFGNGNREFPWASPAGLHRSRNVGSFRFLWLPRDESGNLLPVVWTQKQLNGDSGRGYAWWFPVGTVVGEVLLVQSPAGHGYCFELRVRVREKGDWGVEVFRPFPTAESLAKRVKELRPTWEENEKLTALVEHLEQPVELVTKTLADDQPNVRTFQQAMGIDSLPPLGDDKLVIELLTQTEFSSAAGATWRSGTNRVLTFAPTTDAPFHVVPVNYDAGFIEVEKASCARCHATTNQHVNNFNSGRDWYGRIRGSDGIFSFHPFDPSCISYNGFGPAVTLRKELVEARLLQRYDEREHPREIYHRVMHFKE